MGVNTTLIFFCYFVEQRVDMVSFFFTKMKGLVSVVFKKRGSLKFPPKGQIVELNLDGKEGCILLHFQTVHFSKLFKLKTGYSPREFRKSS